MIKLKFKATKAMPSFNGYANGYIIEYPEEAVEKLMADYPDSFEKVGKVLPKKKPEIQMLQVALLRLFFSSFKILKIILNYRSD